MIKKCKKKSDIVEVEAVRLTTENIYDVAAWCKAMIASKTDPQSIYLKNFRGGVSRVRVDDWVLKMREVGELWLFNRSTITKK